MKNLGIILSTWVLLFFAVACMKQEKDVFKSAEAEGRKQGSPIVLQEGGKDEIMGGSIGGTTSSPVCQPPTNLVMVSQNFTTGTFTWSWTPPIGGTTPLGYVVKYYINNGLILTLNVNTNSVTLPIAPPLQSYTIVVSTLCGVGVESPVLSKYEPSIGSGGSAVIVVDNLDNYAPSTTKGVTGSYNGHAFTMSSAFGNTTTNWSIAAENLYDMNQPGLGYTTPSSVTIVPTYNSYGTYLFTIPGAPSLASNIQNIFCPNPDFIDITLNVTSIPLGTVIALQQQNTTGAGTIMKKIITNPAYGKIKFESLTRNSTYKIKFFSAFSNYPNTLYSTYCSSGI